MPRRGKMRFSLPRPGEPPALDAVLAGRPWILAGGPEPIGPWDSFEDALRGATAHIRGIRWDD